MVTVSPVEQWNEANPGRALGPEVTGGLPTLMVEWDGAPGHAWQLRVAELFGDGGGSWGYQPAVAWEPDGDGGWGYAGAAVAAGRPLVRASLRARPAGDALGLELAVENGGEGRIGSCWAWVCLVQRWAQAFQANCELPVGSPRSAEGMWRPVAGIEAPLGRWLKWCAVVGGEEVTRRIAGRIDSPRLQLQVVGQVRMVRAWRMAARGRGLAQQLVELESPEAFALGWSHWPCTDMGLLVGDLEPGGRGVATAELRFRERAFESV